MDEQKRIAEKMPQKRHIIIIAAHKGKRERIKGRKIDRKL
jgi:hypothetical protein